jgi:hypothetical protein
MIDSETEVLADLIEAVRYSASQPGVAVDDRQQRRSQPARDEIVEEAVSIASRTCWWISSPSEIPSRPCAIAGFLIRSSMARSSGGRPARRPAGRELHQPEECAISIFPTKRDTTAGDKSALSLSA